MEAPKLLFYVWPLPTLVVAWTLIDQVQPEKDLLEVKQKHIFVLQKNFFLRRTLNILTTTTLELLYFAKFFRSCRKGSLFFLSVVIVWPLVKIIANPLGQKKQFREKEVKRISFFRVNDQKLTSKSDLTSEYKKVGEIFARFFSKKNESIFLRALSILFLRRLFSVPNHFVSFVRLYMLRVSQ